MTFQNTVSALAVAIAHQACGVELTEGAHERVVKFVIEQQGRMPDYLRLPLKLLTLVFAISSIVTAGRPFHRLPQERQCRQVARWKASRLGPCRDLMKFFESLVIFCCYADGLTPSAIISAGIRHDCHLRQESPSTP